MYIDYGYKLKTKTTKLDYNSALKTMLSKKRERYWKVETEGDVFRFSYRYVICPICGAINEEWDFPASISVNAIEQIDDFFQPQLAFEKTGHRELILRNNNPFAQDKFTCPFCDCIIYQGNEKREIIFDRTDTKAIVRVEVKDFAEFFSAMNIFERSTSFRFSEDSNAFGYEELCLDAQTGRAVLSCIDATGNIVNSIEITEADIPDDICFKLFSSQDCIKSFLLDFLKQFWQRDFPYKELSNVYKAIELNRFKGFSRKFYNSIPYQKGTRKIANGFADIVSHLKNADSLFDYLGSMDIPLTRSIKREIFKKQWLFFYLKELNMLYLSVHNIDVFRKLFLLKEDQLLSILVSLKLFPASICFYHDLVKCKRNIFLEMLINETSDFIAFAINYGMLTGWAKEKHVKDRFEKAIRIMKKSKYIFDEFYCDFIEFSEPLFFQDYKLEDQLDRYCFRFLSSTNETQYAGKKLHNCLVDWRSWATPVVVISVGQQIIAAVELEKNSHEIKQLKLKWNKSITDNYELLLDIEEWRKKHSLGFSQFADEVDEDEYFSALLCESEYDLFYREYTEDDEPMNRVNEYYTQLYNAKLNELEEAI